MNLADMFGIAGLVIVCILLAGTLLGYIDWRS